MYAFDIGEKKRSVKKGQMKAIWMKRMKYAVVET
jgi:hypothetical protein